MERRLGLTRRTMSSSQTSLRPAGGHRRVPELDGLRGVAILMVMFYHFKIYGSGWDFPARHALYNACNFGWAGVDVFFVLSGFLITGILFDARHNALYYRVFYARRTLRIFPLYYASLAIAFFVIPALLMHWGLSGPVEDLRRTPQLPAWCYVQNWTAALPAAVPVSALISHFWSLCVEEQFYVVWPFCVRRLGRGGRILFFAGCLVLLAPLFRWLFHRADMPVAAEAFTVCRMDALALGALLAVGMRCDKAWARIRAAVPWVALLAGAGLLGVMRATGSVRFSNRLMNTAGLSCIDLLAAAALVVLVAGREGAWYTRLARSAPLRFFGKYSYALYVFHQPAIYIMASAGLTGAALHARFHNFGAAIALENLAGFSVSIVLALMSWNLLEKHCLKLKDKVGPEPAAIKRGGQTVQAGI